MMVVVYTNLQATSVILYANRLHFNIVTFIKNSWKINIYKHP